LAGLLFEGKKRIPVGIKKGNQLGALSFCVVVLVKIFKEVDDVETAYFAVLHPVDALKRLVHCESLNVAQLLS
jgi:hypothetical protein